MKTGSAACLFSPKKCVHSIKNFDNEFSAYQAGGRITSYNDNFILLSMGDYKSRPLAQDDRSVNGKIIKISIRDGQPVEQEIEYDKDMNQLSDSDKSLND